MTRLRLWLASRILPHGYAIWTYGGAGGYEFDEPVVAKEPR